MGSVLSRSGAEVEFGSRLLEVVIPVVVGEINPLQVDIGPLTDDADQV
jgi:hypothetical protein